jgi:hypothetical protein
MFAGDATKLYLLSSTTWSDVSRTVGGAYTPSRRRPALHSSAAWRWP